MFESDDYDQLLSQLDFPVPEACEKQQSKCVNQIQKDSVNSNITDQRKSNVETIFTDFHPNKCQETCDNTSSLRENRKTKSNDGCPLSPTHVKRKILNSYFDHKSKRKFPGPAGVLSGCFEEKKDESICQMELLSQDVDFSQNYIHGVVFESPLWMRLLQDTRSLIEINTITSIKQQALVGNLRQKKAHTVTAFVECVDRSAVDPLITLRDKTGHIKCTLHRDAWSSFSTYIAAEHCALVIWKPTILTTGSAFKKHYLNITLSNIWAIYSSAIISEGDTLPDSFQKTCDEDFTVIKSGRCSSDENFSPESESLHESLEDLENVFLDDVF